MQAWKVPGELREPHSKEEALTIPAPAPDITDLEHPWGTGWYLYVSGWYSRRHLFVDHLDYDNVRRWAFADNMKAEPLTGATWNHRGHLTLFDVPEYRLCEDRMICLYRNPEYIGTFVVPQPNPVDAFSLPSPSSSLEVKISRHVHKFSFDPASGRMCCVTLDNKGTVLIYDFLKQPHPSTS